MLPEAAQVYNQQDFTGSPREGCHGTTTATRLFDLGTQHSAGLLRSAVRGPVPWAQFRPLCVTGFWRIEGTVDESPVSVDESPVSVRKSPVSVGKSPVSVDKSPVSVGESPVSVDESPGARPHPLGWIPFRLGRFAEPRKGGFGLFGPFAGVDGARSERAQ